MRSDSLQGIVQPGVHTSRGIGPGSKREIAVCLAVALMAIARGLAVVLRKVKAGAGSRSSLLQERVCMHLQASTLSLSCLVATLSLMCCMPSAEEITANTQT